MFDWKGLLAQLVATVLVALVATIWTMETRSVLNTERLDELQQQLSLLRVRVIELERER